METNFKTFGPPVPFPLPIDGDWVRINCGIDGQPNYIFGLDGLKAFYKAGAGIYSRDKNGNPENPFEYWLSWYEKERKDRINVSATVEEIKRVLLLRTRG